MKKRYAAIPLILSASMLASVPAFAEDGVTVSWYNFGDAFSSYVRDSMSNAFDELGVDATMKDSNNIQQTQNDDLQTAVNTGTSAIVVQMVDSEHMQRQKISCRWEWMQTFRLSFSHV